MLLAFLGGTEDGTELGARHVLRTDSDGRLEVAMVYSSMGLADLNDVNAGLTPSADDVLYYDGSEWVAGNTPEAAHAEMYVYDSSYSYTVKNQSQVQFLISFLQGDLNGWTFEVYKSVAVLSFADYSGTVAGTVRANFSGAHGMATGDVVSISGTTNYNGVYEITVIDSTSIYFTATWVTNDAAGLVIRGSALVAGAGAAGDYGCSFSLSAAAGAAGKAYRLKVYKNTSPQNNIVAEQEFASTDVESIGGQGVLAGVAAGDRIMLAVEAQDSGVDQTIVFKHLNLTLRRL